MSGGFPPCEMSECDCPKCRPSMWAPEWQLDWAACRALAIERRKALETLDKLYEDSAIDFDRLSSHDAERVRALLRDRARLEAERDALLRRSVCFYGLSDDLVYADASRSAAVEGCGEFGAFERIVSFRLEPSGDVFRLRYEFEHDRGWRWRVRHTVVSGKLSVTPMADRDPLFGLCAEGIIRRVTMRVRKDLRLARARDLQAQNR